MKIFINFECDKKSPGKKNYENSDAPKIATPSSTWT